MKLPSSMLRRLASRHLGPRAPDGMTREAFAEALADLPSDVDPEELREFVEADGEPACPVFREKLRSLLWAWVGHQEKLGTARRARHYLN